MFFVTLNKKPISIKERKIRTYPSNIAILTTESMTKEQKQIDGSPGPIDVSPADFVASLSSDEEVVAYYGTGIKKKDDKFQEQVVQIRRVTKVVKGGKQLSFRAVVVVGDENGLVGVGVASAKEVIGAVNKAVADASKNISVQITKNNSIAHRIESRVAASHIVLRPASEGTGVVA